MKEDSKQLRYVIYARKSSESDDKQMTSIEDQLKELNRLAERLNINIVETFTESQSAKKPGRPKFNDMLNYIHEGKADAILCWKLNRLARNPVDGGTISWLLQQGTVQNIQTFSGSFKPSDNVIMMQVEFGMANQYVKELSVDTKRGQRQKAERGWYSASQLPIGYKGNPKTKQEGDGSEDEIICDSNNFDIVSSLWDKFLSGKYSVPEIKRFGDKSGLRSRRGTFLTLNSYHNMLSNKFYCGLYDWNDEFGEPVEHKGKHKAIVSEVEFNVIQKMLGKRGRQTRAKSYKYPFKGPMRCGSCDSAITAEQKEQATCDCKHKFSMKNRTDCPKCGLDISEMKNVTFIDKTYYHCYKRKDGCKELSIEQQDIEKQLKKEIDKVQIPEKFYDWAVKALEYMNKEEMGEQRQESSIYSKRETELLNQVDNYIRMRGNNEIDESQFTRFKLEAENKLEDLRKDVKHLHERTTNWMDVANEYLNFAKNVEDSFEKGGLQAKSEILSALGSNVTLKDKKLKIVLPKPLSIISETYEIMRSEKEWFEPKNTIDKQGRKRVIMVPNSVGLRGQDSNL